MKEIPMSVLVKRRKYYFLTEELKKYQIRFCWERQEGILITYNSERHRIVTVEQAKGFLKILKKDVDQAPPEKEWSKQEKDQARLEEEIKREHEIRENWEKRLRRESPDKYNLYTAKNMTTQEEQIVEEIDGV